MTFPVVRDTDNGYGLFRSSLSETVVSPFPFDVVIDREGRLISARVEYDPGALLEDIASLLD